MDCFDSQHLRERRVERRIEEYRHVEPKARDGGEGEAHRHAESELAHNRPEKGIELAQGDIGQDDHLE